MKFKERLFSIISMLPGWLLIIPFSFLFRKRRGLIIVISRDANQFSDNTKYFYSYLINNNYKNAYFLYETDPGYMKNIPGSLAYPSLKSVLLLLHAEYIIVDTATWFYNFKFYLSFKAKKIQLWHGISSKKIELATDFFCKSKFRIIKIWYGILRGQFVKYNLITSTSEYYSKHLYSDAFRYKHILPLGQPRNDIFFRTPQGLDMINTDKKIYTKLKDLKSRLDAKIILYTPTYRENLSMDLLNLDRINRFAKKNNFLFVIKHHVLTRISCQQEYNRVFYYSKYNDIYPLMCISDMMLTDYSSIYMDYILRDKPIVFFIPDYEQYNKYEAGLRPDFFDMTPGPKVYNMDDLYVVLKTELLTEGMNYREERQKISDLAYKHKDCKSSERIYKYIKNKQLNR
ncbi:MAG: CDP-glycerol glycerophosphotransferase family protein [Bacteroidales bacterium]